MAPLHQKPGVSAVQVPPLGLDVGPDGAAHIRPLVVAETALLQGPIDHVGSALHQAPLVRVLNAQNKGAARVAGDEPGVQGGAQIAHVHVTGGRGGKAGTHPAMGDARLHLIKPLHIQSHIKNLRRL